MNDRTFEDEKDFFGDDSLIANPYPYFDDLRNQCPVHREPHHDVVLITGHQEGLEVYANPKTFSACNTVTGPFPPFPVPLEGDDVSELIDKYRDALPMSKEIMTADAPRHTGLRALAARHFTPRRLGETEGFMHRLADRLIDEFADRGQCEFVTDFAGRYTVLTICELLGVPESDQELFLRELLGPHRDRQLGQINTGTPADPFGFLHERFAIYIDECRAEPRDDVMTRVATTPYPDGSIPEVDDIVRLASSLFVGGTGTTTHMLGSALKLLGERSDLQELLRKDPEKIPNFVEEILRLESPIKANHRMSRIRSIVGGETVPAGRTVTLIISAMNRDPRKFEEPNDFRIDRDNARQHLAFGHGLHLCVGAALARAEGRIGIEHLLTRLNDIKVSESKHGPEGARTYQYAPSYMVRGLQNLYLEFESAAPQ